MSLSDWMKPFAGRRLSDMHLPGAHDAGTAKGYIDLTAGGTNSNAATQKLTITQMLGVGTRFFDLRLKSKGGRVVAHHTTAGQGAYSRISVDDVIQDAAQFCNAHKGEVVIFRISHTSDSTNAQDIIKASGGTALHRGTGNLCHKTLGDITKDGNLICILDEEKFGTVIDQSQGIHGFSKYTSGSPTNNRGIAACGCYSRTHELHKVICNGLRGQYEHNAQHGARRGHLWQVYWQKTYVNPASTTGIKDGTTAGHYYTQDLLGNHTIHGGTHSSTRHMLRLMQGLGARQGEDYRLAKKTTEGKGDEKVTTPKVMYSTLDVRDMSLPNIVSYDFVNDVVNQQIIKLNSKGLQGTPTA